MKHYHDGPVEILPDVFLNCEEVGYVEVARDLRWFGYEGGAYDSTRSYASDTTSLLNRFLAGELTDRKEI